MKTRMKKFIRFVSRLEVIGMGLAIVGAIIFVAFLIRLCGADFIFWNSSFEFEKTGQIGDFAGGFIGAIWSLAGVILFYSALKLQRETLDKQGDEIVLQTSALKTQKEAMDLQNEELELTRQELKSTREVFSTQLFENHFFSLLEAQRDIVARATINETQIASLKIKVRKKKNKFQGVDFFQRLYQELIDLYKIDQVENTSGMITINNEILGRNIDLIKNSKEENALLRTFNIYWLFFFDYQSYLGHYFRHLYHILKYIWRMEKRELDLLSPDIFGPGDFIKSFGEKYETKYLANRQDAPPNLILEEKDYYDIRKKYDQYAAVIQAQMSIPELGILFYNALCFPKMYKLVRRYDLLNNLTEDQLIDPENHKGFYGEGTIKKWNDKLREPVQEMVDKPWGIELN